MGAREKLWSVSKMIGKGIVFVLAVIGLGLVTGFRMLDFSDRGEEEEKKESQTSPGIVE